VTAILAPLHGLFNLAIGFLIAYQGFLGLKIRKARRAASPFPVKTIKRHRRIGPFLPILSAFGFAAGLLLIRLDHRRLLAFSAHFFLGLSIVFFLVLMRRIGLRIKGPDSPFRTRHFGLGMLLLLIYVVQAFLGLSLLL
jgi:hypothetical protein